MVGSSLFPGRLDRSSMRPILDCILPRPLLLFFFYFCFSFVMTRNAFFRSFSFLLLFYWFCAWGVWTLLFSFSLASRGNLCLDMVQWELGKDQLENR